MPVHNYIYEAGVYRMKAMITSEKLGDITQFYMMYNIHHAKDVRKRYPGVIHQILTHHSYTMLYLIGKPATVSCIKHTIGCLDIPQENVAMVIMKMRNGALSHLSASFANDDHAGDPWTCMIKVMGTKGSARYSYRDWVINERNEAHSQTYYCYPESIKNVTEYFINDVIRNGKEPLSGIGDAITAQQIVEACYQSEEEGVHIHYDECVGNISK
jgi:predicted dehydrogenase